MINVTGWFHANVTVPILDLIEAKFDEWLPKILDTIVATIAASLTRTAANLEDKVTDLIPGTADDNLLDPLVKNALQTLDNLFRRP